MSTFIVNGGKKLKGSVDVRSGKNAPIAILVASLMIQGTVRLKNMSKVEDVRWMLSLFASIGVQHEWEDETTLRLDTAAPLTMKDIDKELCAKMRITINFLGALASREKKYTLYKTGGCHLGERSVRPHLHPLKQLGIHVTSGTDEYRVETKNLAAADIAMLESGDTPTENVIMAAVQTPGKTTIRFASANYMVQDLCHFLVAAGADIQGIGTTTLVVNGGAPLHSVEEYYISPDPVDAMAWLSLAVTTQSSLTVQNCSLDFLRLELEHLKLMGQEYSMSDITYSKGAGFPIADITIKPSSLTALPDKLHGRPYPGMNIDNVPLFTPMLTQAKGQTLIHDWMYENRAIYYLELQRLGAKVILLDPHRVIIEGKTPLQGNEIICPSAIRPGMAILIAMLAAKGTSTLRNAYPVERGYEDIVQRLRDIGADITRED